ncbi:MAG TPA: hypothetical protein VEP90_02665, partial [Methylomirabilota bacterium]|nr:hypothetical protein [Methylomirabilota bacterium]
MLTSSITATIVYASPSPHSTSPSNGRSGSSTHSNDESKINSESSSSGGVSNGNSGSSGSDSPASADGTGSSSGGGGNTAHCDRPGYPSCSSLGSEAGKVATGTSCPSGHSTEFCKSYVAAAGSSANSPPGSPLQQGNTAHCDSSGYPSCYSLGYVDGKNHPGTSCPGGHSQNYCNGYGAGTGSLASNNNNNNSTTRSLSLHSDAIHCDQVAWPSCYSVGYQDGVANLGISCPSGHT